MPVAIVVPPAAEPVLRILSDNGLQSGADRNSVDLSVGLKGDFGNWRWSGSLIWQHDRTNTTTGLGFDPTALQDAVSTGSLAPGAAIPNDLLAPLPDAMAHTGKDLWQANFYLNGPLALLPAGPLGATIQGSAADLSLDVSNTDGFGSSAVKLDRKAANIQASLQIPLTSDKSPIGALSGSIEGAVIDLSDFGTLLSYATSFEWRPTPSLSVNGAYTRQEPTATLLQLGAPEIVTPNVRVFDFATGSTAEVALVQAGNPVLEKSDQRTFQAGVTWRPLQGKRRLAISSTYIRVTTDKPIGQLPYDTPEGYLAFADRFTRSAGILVSIDARPVNLDHASADYIRSGVSLSLPVGAEANANRGRLRASAFYTYQLNDTVWLTDSVKLDYLHGSALGPLGGRSRNMLEASASYYSGGLGAQFDLTWQDGSRVGRGPEQLNFSARSRVDIRLFADTGIMFHRNSGLLNGMRASLTINNLFNDRIDVLAQDGSTPLRYQSQLIEPLGRTIGFDLRKRF